MLRALILGIVQGLTEFLPISSSAHLSIVPKLLGYPTPELSFEVLLHFGTLAAVVAYFARDLWAFVLCLVAPSRLGAQETRLRRRLLFLLALATVPAVIFGALLSDASDRAAGKPLRAAVFIVLTTAIMIAAELYDRHRARQRIEPAVPVAAPAGDESAALAPGGQVELHQGRAALAGAADPQQGGRVMASRAELHRGRRTAARRTAARQAAAQRTGAGQTAARQAAGDAEAELESLPVGKAAGIGLAQAFALIPGVSRSGVTISTGLLEGVSREAAARFSFLLSIPAILGAGALKLGNLTTATETVPQLVVGFLAAAVSGFLAVSFLLRLLRTHTLWPFIWYRLAAGSLFILLLLIVRA